MFVVRAVASADCRSKIISNIVFATKADATEYGAWYAKLYNVTIEVHEIPTPSVEDRINALVQATHKDFVEMLQIDDKIRDGAFTVPVAKFVLKISELFRALTDDAPVPEVSWAKFAEEIQNGDLPFGTMLILFGNAGAAHQLQTFTTKCVSAVHAILKDAGMLIPSIPPVPAAHRLLVPHPGGQGSTLVIFGAPGACKVITLAKKGPVPESPATYTIKRSSGTSGKAAAGSSTDPAPPPTTGAYEITVTGLGVEGLNELTFQVESDFKLLKA